MRLDMLTFPEFLNAIGRAYDASNASTNSVSLIEASQKRWTTGPAAVYSKSMVVAFLYDLRTRSAKSRKEVAGQRLSGDAAKALERRGRKDRW
mgnify:CR=1 FL=1